MCLEFQRKPVLRKATKDIPVFKCIRDNGFGIYENIKIDNIDEPWTQGFHYTEPDFKEKALKKDGSGDWVVEGDAFHSCKEEHEAQWHKDGLNCSVVKMHIPKGAYYYVNDGTYASSDIVYPKQIKKWQNSEL